MFELSAVVFYVLAIVIILASAAVVLVPNPIYSALALAGTMVALGFMYFQLDAYFIAGVQLIVYAGAVMVLFVMVLMLFDLKTEDVSISGGVFGTFLKVMSGMIFTMLLTWAIRKSVPATPRRDLPDTAAEQMSQVKALAVQIFTKYLFAFEALGVLLLVIAVGVVAVSRSKGGTHARN